jgi:hypothetical protein
MYIFISYLCNMLPIIRSEKYQSIVWDSQIWYWIKNLSYRIIHFSQGISKSDPFSFEGPFWTWKMAEKWPSLDTYWVILIIQVKVLRILKGLGEILSQSRLLTFEFWLNRTQVVKAKHCWGLSTNFLFSVQYNPDTKQNIFFFSSLAELCQKLGILLESKVI